MRSPCLLPLRTRAASRPTPPRKGGRPNANPRISAAASASTSQPSTMSASLVSSGPMVADAADAWHEQHRRRQPRRQDLRVVAGPAGHAHDQARRVALGGMLQHVLESGIHRRRRRARQALQRDAAGPLACLRHQRVQLLFQPVEHRRIGVAELEQHLGPAGDDAGRARFQRDPSRRPHRPRPGDVRKPPVDRAGQPHQRHAGVRRIAMRVVPAWFCTPSKAMRKPRVPTMLVTTPSRCPELSSSSPCSICASR